MYILDEYNTDVHSIWMFAIDRRNNLKVYLSSSVLSRRNILLDRYELSFPIIFDRIDHNLLIVFLTLLNTDDRVCRRLDILFGY